MKGSIRALETDLKTFKPHNERDRFGKVMEAFIVKAREEAETLQAMFEKMERLYNDLGSYFVFEVKKYALDEFFGDVKTFKDQFGEAYNEVLRLREEEDKKRRQQQAKEQAEKVRELRKNNKNQFVDMNKDEEGVMDNLLVALQTGKAFGQRRKRAQPSGGMGSAEKKAVLNRTRSRGSLENALSSTTASRRYGNDSHC
jgi:diaphanous 2